MARPSNEEVSAKTAIAVQAMTGAALVIGGKTFKNARWVTRTVLKQELNVPFYVRFDGAITLSTMDPDKSNFKDAKGDGQVPEIANVINLETGEFQVLIMNTVLGSELRQNYPDDSYVGKMFGICQTPSDVDKRYRAYKIIELEIDGDAPGGATPTKVIDNGDDAVEAHRANKRAKA